MVVSCENVWELSPSWRDMGCCHQDSEAAFLSYVCICAAKCICSAVSRLIRFKGCIVLCSSGGCETDPITKISDKDRDSFNTPGDWTLSLQASSRI